MSTAPFDTHAAVKRLTATGMAEVQAEALIRAITEAQARADLVTKTDIRDMATKSDIKDLRHELSALESRLDSRMAALESRLIKWTFVQAIAIIGLTVTLVRLLS